MPKKIEYYQEIALEDIKRDYDQNVMFQEIDKMWNCDWELPPSLKAQTYMRAFRTTAPRDAMWAAGRVLASRMPFINVQPYSASANGEGTEEKIESLLDWNLYNIIHRSKSDPLMDMSMSAVKYSQIAFQTIYIPYEFKGRTDARARAIRRQGDFAFRIHNPQNVHARYNEYCLEAITLNSHKTAKEIADMFPYKAAEIAAYVGAGSKTDESIDALMQRTKCVLYDFTDYEDRVIWMSLTETMNPTVPNKGAVDHFEILREAHGLPFMPWVFKKDNYPIMKPVVDANLYSNINMLESLRYYLVIATVAQARSWSKTITGEGVEIDHGDPASQVTMKAGEDFGILEPSQLDPNINSLIESVRGDIRQTTVAEALTTIDKLASGTPYATVNAILQASIAAIANIQKLTESALEDSFKQMLQWIDYSDIALLGKRRTTKNSDSPMMMAGADLYLQKGDFDPDQTYIHVTLNTTTTTDKDASYNRAILMSSRLPISPRRALEENGIEYTEADMQDWAAWQYLTAEQQADLARITMAPELEAQAQMMQMQAAQAQEQQASAEGAELEAQSQAAAQPSADQFETSQGEAGLSPASAQPSATRESISNMDSSGMGIG